MAFNFELISVHCGQFSRHYEDAPNQFVSASAPAHLAGLGIGLLSAAAVSISSVLGDLPLAGAEVIRVAFRLGVTVNRISESLEPRDPTASSPDSWACVIPGVNVQEARDALNELQEKEVSYCNSLYLIMKPDSGSLKVSRGSFIKANPSSEPNFPECLE